MSKKALYLLISCLLLFCAQPAMDLAYPNAKQCNFQRPPYVLLPEGVAVTVYCVNAEIEKVLDYYSKIQGYEIVTSPAVTTISTPEGGVKFGQVVIKKGNEGIAVFAISPKLGETVYWLMKGPVEKFTVVETPKQTPAKLPSQDQARGEEPLQRYPKSVMLSHSKSGEFPTIILIEYGTMDSMLEVFNWYRSQLLTAGWKLKEESSGTEKSWLEFEKGAERVGIVIYPPGELGYTQISIHYGVYKVPDKDLAFGEEPLQRYPNSKMISHSAMSYGNVKMVTIKYASADSDKAVLNWYNSHLASLGWQVISTQQEEGRSSITAMSQKGMVQITITSRGTCSEIEVFYQGG